MRPRWETVPSGQPASLVGFGTKRPLGLPNLAVFDQGGAARGAAGPASAPGSALGPAQRTPGHTPRGHSDQDGSTGTGQIQLGGPSSPLPIVQLAATASRAALRADARDRVRRPWTQRPLTRIRRLRGGRGRSRRRCIAFRSVARFVKPTRYLTSTLLRDRPNSWLVIREFIPFKTAAAILLYAYAIERISIYSISHKVRRAFSNENTRRTIIHDIVIFKIGTASSVNIHAALPIVVNNITPEGWASPIEENACGVPEAGHRVLTWASTRPARIR